MVVVAVAKLTMKPSIFLLSTLLPCDTSAGQHGAACGRGGCLAAVSAVKVTGCHCCGNGARPGHAMGEVHHTKLKTTTWLLTGNEMTSETARSKATWQAQHLMPCGHPLYKELIGVVLHGFSG